MRIKELMSHHVQIIGSSSPVKDAADIMKRFDIGALPVQDGDELKGMLTDRDIAVRLVAAGLDPQTAKVSDIMTSQVITCLEDQKIVEVANIMEDKKVRRVIVLNRENQVTGIVSLGDIAAHGTKRLAGEALKKVREAVH